MQTKTVGKLHHFSRWKPTRPPEASSQLRSKEGWCDDGKSGDHGSHRVVLWGRNRRSRQDFSGGLGLGFGVGEDGGDDE